MIRKAKGGQASYTFGQKFNPTTKWLGEILFTSESHLYEKNRTQWREASYLHQDENFQSN